MRIRKLTRITHGADTGTTAGHSPGRRIAARLSSAVVVVVSLLMATTAVPSQAVFNGSPSVPQDYGWVVKVDMAYTQGFASCTGSLIRPDTVVTAAHCIRYGGQAPLATSVTFHSGQNPGQYSVAVTQAVPMPDYDPALIKDDIAMLTLQTSVTEAPIELASTEPPVGASVVVAGYGCTADPFKSQDPCAAPSQLREISVATVAAETCPDIAGAWQFCTYSKERSVKSGDSGGPVVWVEDGVRKLAGVTNAIELPPAASYLNMSASVAYELDWLNSAAGTSAPGTP
jgi:secreted trypsin-like serine protease